MAFGLLQHLQHPFSALFLLIEKADGYGYVASRIPRIPAMCAWEQRYEASFYLFVCIKYTHELGRCAEIVCPR